MKPEYLNEEGIVETKQNWKGIYNDILFNIVFWKRPYMSGISSEIYPNNGIWNSYIIIHRQMIPDDFESLIPELKETKFGSHERTYRDYFFLDEYFKMDGGITFYESLFNEEGKIIVIKVGNDYNHSFNGIVSFDDVFRDVKESINEFCERFPNRLVRSTFDGKWIKPEELKEHDKAAKERIFRKNNNNPDLLE